MPSSRYYRYPILGQEQRQKRQKKIIITIFLFLVVILFLWVIYLSPVFEIRNFQIGREDKMPQAEIRQVIENSDFYSKIPFLYKLFPSLQSNLIFLSKTKLEKNLTAAFPETKNIKINKKLPHTLKIVFDLREQMGIWCGLKSDCFYIDSDGVIFNRAPESEGALLFKVQDLARKDADEGEKVIDTVFLSFLSDFKKRLYDIKKIGVVLYKFNPESRLIEAQTGEGWAIIMEQNQDLDALLNNLVSALNEIIKNKRASLKYIDLRIPDRIFYKLK